ncbi:MAG TPA: hypothetical protein VGJ88_08610 [Thermoanaerobaculia bacterium]|jgi:hypothetical protein
MKSGERRAQFAAVILVFAFAAAASACPVCYGTAQTPLTKGVNNGILFLLGIVGSVQVGFVALFFSFWKRTKALQQKREQFKIIEGGKER